LREQKRITEMVILFYFFDFVRKRKGQL
jgi:hypothetical protein